MAADLQVQKVLPLVFLRIPSVEGLKLLIRQCLSHGATSC